MTPMAACPVQQAMLPCGWSFPGARVGWWKRDPQPLPLRLGH